MNIFPKKYSIDTDNIYIRIQSVCSFIAGMSDGAAILLHKKIKGIDV